MKTARIPPVIWLCVIARKVTPNFLERIQVTGTKTALFDEADYWGGDTSLGETADPGRPRQVLFTTSVVLR